MVVTHRISVAELDDMRRRRDQAPFNRPFELFELEIPDNPTFEQLIAIISWDSRFSRNEEFDREFYDLLWSYFERHSESIPVGIRRQFPTFYAFKMREADLLLQRTAAERESRRVADVLRNARAILAGAAAAMLPQEEPLPPVAADVEQPVVAPPVQEEPLPPVPADVAPPVLPNLVVGEEAVAEAPPQFPPPAAEVVPPPVVQDEHAIAEAVPQVAGRRSSFKAKYFTLVTRKRAGVCV